uniref:Uncharacterized protein n=1 Tax=Oryza glumipatula TaxID=40148 RepID=A0A0D9ZGV9_9ORYZ
MRSAWAQRLRLRQCRCQHGCTIRGKQLGGGGGGAEETGGQLDSYRAAAEEWHRSCGMDNNGQQGSWFVHGACRLLFQFQAQPKYDSCAAPREGVEDWGESQSQDGRKASVLRVAAAEGWLDGGATDTGTQQCAAVWLE